MSLSNKMEDLLSGYLDNQLRPDELREVEAALLEPQVQAYLDDLKQNRESLKLLSVQSQSAPHPDFAKLVLAQLASKTNEVSKPEPQRRFDARIFVALAALAAALVVAIVVLKDDSSTVLLSGDKLVVNDPSNAVEPTTIDSPPEDSVEKGRLVGGGDLSITYLMTVDVEVSKGSTSATAVVPLLAKYGINLIKGSRVTKEVEKALDEMRMLNETNELAATTEVFLVRADTKSAGDFVEALRVDSASFPRLRIGMAYEIPTDPLLDKLSLNAQNNEANELLSMLNMDSATLALGKAIANSIVDSREITASSSFAAPLVDGDYRPSPFEAVPEQGKLVGSKIRRQPSALSQQVAGEEENSFVLLFVRQR